MFVKSYKSCYYAKSNLGCTFLPLNTVMKPLTNLDWWLFYIAFRGIRTGFAMDNKIW